MIRRPQIVDRRSAQIASVIIALDQVAKYITKKKFTVVENSALPFGVNFPGHFNLIIIAAALAVFIFFSRKYFRNSFAAALVIGGAFSNLIDRLANGKVTDFINLGISSINLADIAIYVGIGLLIFFPERTPSEVEGESKGRPSTRLRNGQASSGNN